MHLVFNLHNPGPKPWTASHDTALNRNLESCRLEAFLALAAVSLCNQKAISVGEAL